MNEETSENQTLVSRGKFISGVNYRRKYAVLYVALVYWLRFNSIEHLTKPVNNANEDETFVFPHKNAPLINWKLKNKTKLSMCFKTLSFVTWIYLEHAGKALLPPTSLFPLVSNLAVIVCQPGYFIGYSACADDWTPLLYVVSQFTEKKWWQFSQQSQRTSIRTNTNMLGIKMTKHPSVTHPVASIFSPGFRQKRYWVDWQFFPLGCPFLSGLCCAFSSRHKWYTLRL